MIRFGGVFIKYNVVKDSPKFSGDDDIVLRVLIYNVPKILLTKVNEIGNILGINTRSGVIKFIIKHYYDDFKYLIDPSNSAYIFLDYSVKSYANDDLLKVITKYEIEVMSIKPHGENVNRMVLSIDDITKINKIVTDIVKIDGILTLKFVGV